MRILCPGAEESGRTGAPRRQNDHWQVKDSLYDVMRGNFTLAVSEGTYGGAPTSYYDLWRVESGKIAEHWDVTEAIADASTWQDQNGRF